MTGVVFGEAASPKRFRWVFHLMKFDGFLTLWSLGRFTSSASYSPVCERILTNLANPVLVLWDDTIKRLCAPLLHGLRCFGRRLRH